MVRIHLRISHTVPSLDGSQPRVLFSKYVVLAFALLKTTLSQVE